MRIPFALPALSLVGFLACSCGGGNAASQLAKAPEYNPKDQTKCGVEKSQAKPLIVEWPSADRGELETQAHEHGLVVVRYQGCVMQVLDGCMVAVKYGYAPMTRKKDRVVMRDADDLYANIPVGAAKFEAKLEKSGELDVDMTMVGRWEADRRAVRLDELQGSCDGATHVVSALTVGAFTFTAGADATVGGGATVMGAGAGAQSTSKREMLNADGDEGACEKASLDDKGPPAQCGALLRVEVVPLAATGSGTPTCPPGSAWNGSQCAGTPSASCPAGMHFQVGRGCLPDVVAAPPAPFPQPQAAPVAAAPSGLPSCSSGWPQTKCATQDDLGDGTFRAAGDVWQKDTSGRMTWADAKVYCTKLSLAGGGWRLPSAAELSDLYSARGYPAFPDMRGRFWSKDASLLPNTATAVSWSSLGANSNGDATDALNLVRCAR